MVTLIRRVHLSAVEDNTAGTYERALDVVERRGERVRVAGTELNVVAPILRRLLTRGIDDELTDLELGFCHPAEVR